MPTTLTSIPFNVPYLAGSEPEHLRKVLELKKFCGDGSYTKKCHELLSQKMENRKALLTTSCTHALEMAAILANIKPGDEVILPSFTFVSTANAFVLRGARIRFVDVNPDTMNIDPKSIAAAVTKRTRAIVVVHYGGVACDMDEIQHIADQANLLLIEDAAQGIGAFYKERPLGTLSDFSTFSFHETKNLHCGEGGALILKWERDHYRSELIREKGTDRSRFMRGQVDKYTWQDLGSSYLPSEFNAAVLWAQLQDLREVTARRRQIWSFYQDSLRSFDESGRIKLAAIPKDRKANGHLFWIKCRDLEDREALISYLRERGVSAAFHYVPLHSSPAGRAFGEFVGHDTYTTSGSETLLRLPVFYNMSQSDQSRVVEVVAEFLRA